MVDGEEYYLESSLTYEVCQSSHVCISSRQGDRVLAVAKCFGLGNKHAKDEQIES